MNSPIPGWIKSHKLLCLLLILIGYLLMKPSPNQIFPLTRFNKSSVLTNEVTMMPPSPDTISSNMGYAMPSSSDVSYQAKMISPPVNLPGPRMVNKVASLSLVVANVNEVASQIEEKAQSIGGYLISSSLSDPGEKASATISVRVPTAQLISTLDSFKALSIKVASQQIDGNDITDQYTNVRASLKPLQETYTELEKLRLQTNKVEEKMNILMQLQNLQVQIDSLMGKERYLQDSAETSLITVYLSTDEFELPYAPKDNWSARVIFKQAVRDLVVSLRGYAAQAIYAVVYGAIWLPILLLMYIAYRILRRRMMQDSPRSTRIGSKDPRI